MKIVYVIAGLECLYFAVFEICPSSERISLGFIFIAVLHLKPNSVLVLDPEKKLVVIYCTIGKKTNFRFLNIVNFELKKLQKYAAI